MELLYTEIINQLVPSVSKVLFGVSHVRKTLRSMLSFHYKVLGVFSELFRDFVQAAQQSVVASCLTA